MQEALGMQRSVRFAQAFAEYEAQTAMVVRTLRGDGRAASLRAGATGIQPETKSRPNQIEGEVKGKPRLGQYRELLIQPVYQYATTVDEVRSAIFQLEIGTGFHPSLLWRTLLADDRISACMNTLVFGLLALPWDITPDEDNDSDEAKEVAEVAKKQWLKMAPKGELAATLRSGMGLGVGFTEKIWDEDWNPRIKNWDNQYTWWNIGTHTYFLNTDPTGAEQQMQKDGATIEIPENGDDHWAIYHPYRGSQGWWDALLRPLSMLWLVRSWALRDWARFSEVFGQPILAAMVPEWADVDQRENFITQLVNIGNSGVAELPVRGTGEANFDLKLVQALASEGGTTGQNKLLDYLDGCIAIRILGQNLTTNISQKGGSHAAAKVHDAVKQDIISYWGGTIEEWANECVLTPWTVYRYGDKTLAPKLKLQVDPPEDLVQKSTALLNVSNAAMNFQTAGYPVDGPALLDEYAIPRKEDEDVKPPAPGDEDDPDKDPDRPAEDDSEGTAALAAARRRRRTTPVAAGQKFVDKVVSPGAAELARLSQGDLRELLAVIDGATSLEDAKTRVLAAYKDLPEPQAMKLVHAGLLLGNLGGRLAARK